MKNYLYLLLFSLCCSGVCAQPFAHRMESAIDAGTYSTLFTYTDTKNTDDYTDDYTCNNPFVTYKPPAKDIFYKLTIAISMDVCISNKTSPFRKTITYVVDAAGKELRFFPFQEDKNGSFKISLLPGTYYIISETFIDNPNIVFTEGPITTSIEGKARTPGEDFFYPIDAGTFDSDFEISPGVEHFNNYILDYCLGDPNDNVSMHDIVHRLAVTRPMTVSMDLCDVAFVPGYNTYQATLMSATKDTIREKSTSYACSYSERRNYELEPGTYYIYSRCRIWRMTASDRYVINIKGKARPPGSGFSSPVEIGSQSEGFTYTDTRNTGAFPKGKFNHKAGNEAYYRITLAVPMEISADNCGSSIADTYLQVFSAGEKLLYSNDNYTGAGACPNTQSAYIKIPVLQPGTYYIVSDAAANGNITTTVRGKTLGPAGDMKETAIDASAHEAGFFFSDTKDTSTGFTSRFDAKPANDVFYKFTLLQPADVTASHCGSVLADTYMSILDAGGAVVYSNDNYTDQGQCANTGNALIKVARMPAGTYYVVSEGNARNGVITTSIEAESLYGDPSTTWGQPHVVSLTPAVECADATLLGSAEVQRTIQYFNRFGNPEVKIQYGFAPLGDNLVTLQEYDGLGRESNLWLPVLKSRVTGGRYLSPGEIIGDAKKSAVYGNDPSPYSKTVYDGSPQNFIVEQYGPGNDWHVNGRSVKTDRMTNLSAEDARTNSSPHATYLTAFVYTPAGAGLANTGAYPTGSLHVVRVTDEDNNVSFEFKDKAGRAVLVRQIENGRVCDTYRVYDDYGKERMVLPPEASDRLAAVGSWEDGHAVLQQYAYMYKYDVYNRCIWKKLPGCGPVYYVYDGADRLIFSQDGGQRVKNEWSFSIPDAFGQVVLTGVCKNV